ncbi:MAG: hypothetical protein ACLQU5_00825 [Isosphaeraceae bacterium]
MSTTSRLMPLALAAFLISCGDEEPDVVIPKRQAAQAPLAEGPQAAPNIPIVQQPPKQIPRPPVMQALNEEVQGLSHALRDAQAQPDPTQIFHEIYAKYAAAVAQLEQDTQSISYKDTKRRIKFYWTPLDEVAKNLQQEYSINPELLARIVQLGLHEKWPTSAPGDAEAYAKMLRRFNTEQALAIRRANAKVNMSALDQMVGAAIMRATAAGTAHNAAYEMWARRMVGSPFVR